MINSGFRGDTTSDAFGRPGPAGHSSNCVNDPLMRNAKGYCETQRVKEGGLRAALKHQIGLSIPGGTP